MAAEQPVRRGTDWVAARDYWLAQPPPRSSQPVANRFRVSRARVNFVRKRDGWDAIAEDLDRKSLEQVSRRIVRTHADRVEKLLGIIDGSLDVFDEQLVEKAREARLRDIGELARTAQLLLGEATERMEISEVKDALGSSVRLAVEALQNGWTVEEFLGRWRLLFGADQAEAA